jgi:hypothetical protein
MRQVGLFATALLVAAFCEISAQDMHTTTSPVASGRQINQQARIAHGVTTGALTQAEHRALKAEQRHIRRVKRKAKADGIVSNEEKLRINRKQRRANRHIRRQKHDAQVRH